MLHTRVKTIQHALNRAVSHALRPARIALFTAAAGCAPSSEQNAEHSPFHSERSHLGVRAGDGFELSMPEQHGQIFKAPAKDGSSSVFGIPNIEKGSWHYPLMILGGGVGLAFVMSQKLGPLPFQNAIYKKLWERLDRIEKKLVRDRVISDEDFKFVGGLVLQANFPDGFPTRALMLLVFAVSVGVRGSDIQNFLQAVPRERLKDWQQVAVDRAQHYVDSMLRGGTYPAELFVWHFRDDLYQIVPG